MFFKPFCDWLSISYPLSSAPLSEILAFLSGVGVFVEEPKGKGKTNYRSDFGTMWVTEGDNYLNFSLSGGLLRALREAGRTRDLYFLLDSVSHNITRFDAAYDIPVRGSEVIRGIEKTFYTGCAVISGHVRNLCYTLSSDSGVRTGSVYFQDSKYKGNLSLKVYDKAHEALTVRSEVLPPTTRYELTVRRGASLADLMDASSIFWHYMPEKLLRRPDGLLVRDWSPKPRVDYDSVTPSLTTDYEKLRYLIENSISLSQLVSHAQSVTGGDALLLRLVEKALSVRPVT